MIYILSFKTIPSLTSFEMFLLNTSSTMNKRRGRKFPYPTPSEQERNPKTCYLLKQIV